MAMISGPVLDSLRSLQVRVKCTGARMMSWLKTKVSPLSILISGYFFWAFHLHVGFPPTNSLTGTSSTYLMLFVFFAVLPFAQRLRIGKFIEYERMMQEVQEDVGELTTGVGAVANISSPAIGQSVITDTEEAQPSKGPPRHIQEYLEADDSNLMYALGRLRMDLERELRRILGEPAVAADDPLKRRGRAAILTARILFRQLGSRNSRYINMRNLFDYVIENCNGAVHARHIPEHVAHEVIDMGLRILGELKDEPEDQIASVIRDPS